MTAVEWLVKELVELDKQLDGRRKNDDATVIKLNPTKIYEQALKMEKEQILKAQQVQKGDYCAVCGCREFWNDEEE